MPGQLPGHVPGIGGLPLRIEGAGRPARARGGGRGFEAAAVEGFGVATLDRRPFGFLAPHLHTRLVLAAGRVSDPEPYREDEENC